MGAALRIDIWHGVVSLTSLGLLLDLPPGVFGLTSTSPRPQHRIELDISGSTHWHHDAHANLPSGYHTQPANSRHVQSHSIDEHNGSGHDFHYPASIHPVPYPEPRTADASPSINHVLANCSMVDVRVDQSLCGLGVSILWRRESD
jgi:hypothetical protein